MGAWVSDNYDQVTPVFQTGFWKVHSAVKKSTHENVFLWQMDEELLKKLTKSTSSIDQYVKNCLSGLQMQRRLHHPHILKIHEINETSRPLSFSSEPIENIIKVEERYSKDEVLYIAKQLSETLHFLHETAHVAHLGIQPSSVCLTKDFSVKLTNFAYAAQIAENEESFLIEKSSAGQVFQVPTSFMSLEQYQGKQLKCSTDVFSFAALITSLLITRNLYEKPVPGTGKLVPRTLEEDTRDALEACFADDPSERPSFEQLRKCTGICVMTTQILNYVDQAFAKTAQDKFAFFKGLFKALPGLSTRILMSKLLPFMETELKNDIRFSPAVVPLIINIGERFDSQTFMEKIFPTIEPYLTITNPPELSMAVFATLNILIDKIPPERHFEVIYPVFTSALETKNPKLHKEAIKRMPQMVELLPTNVVDSSIVPKLTNFIDECDGSSLPPIVKCMAMCAEKVNQRQLVKSAMPKISNAFIKAPSNEAAEEIAKLLASIRVPSDVFMRYCVPIAAVISSHEEVSPNIVKLLCKMIHGCVKQTCEERCGAQFQQQVQQQQQPKANDAKKENVVADNKNEEEEEYYYDEEEEEEEKNVQQRPVIKQRVQPEQKKPYILPKAKPAEQETLKIRTRATAQKPKHSIERRIAIKQETENEAVDDILFGERKTSARSKLKTKY